MERKIVRIGNSYGIVIPQTVLKLAGLNLRNKLKLKIQKNKIILTSSEEK